MNDIREWVRNLRDTVNMESVFEEVDAEVACCSPVTTEE